MRTIRWGIIGCGDVCEIKSGPGFQKAEHSALTAVMRRNGDKARDFAARHGVPRWYDDAAALIADPEVDAVYVATPPDAHAPNVLAAARAGKPVYVEKPMGRNHGECLEMIAACRGAGAPLFTAYYRRRLPRFLKVKEILDQGGIGEVRTVSVTLCHVLKADFLRKENPPWRVVPEIAGGGRFVEHGGGHAGRPRGDPGRPGQAGVRDLRERAHPLEFGRGGAGLRHPQSAAHPAALDPKHRG
jgi:predicted dehydrogenase